MLQRIAQREFLYGYSFDPVDVNQLKRLGMDEIALRKGHSQYVVVLVYSPLLRNGLLGLRLHQR